MSLSPQAEALVNKLMENAKLEPGEGQNKGETYRVTRQLLADCIGSRVLSPRYIFFICKNCTRKRCTREIAEFMTCLCGGVEMGVWGGDVTTADMAAMVKDAISRERAHAFDLLPH
jgi:hypothetical protein